MSCSNHAMSTNDAATFLADLIIAHTCDIPVHTMGQIAMRTAKANELARALSALAALTGADLDRLARSVPAHTAKETVSEDQKQLGLF